MANRNVIVESWLQPDEPSTSMTGEVASAYLDMERKMFGELTSQIIEDAAQVFAYVGFNAEMIRAALHAHEPLMDIYSKEICTLIAIVLSRGTSIATKGKEKMTPRGVALFNSLCGKYHIKRTLYAKKHLGNTDVTLSRVVASHPELAFRVLMTPNLERPISIGAMTEAGYTNFAPGLRGSYVFSCFPLPRTVFHTGLAAGALAYMAFETRLLRAKTEPLSLEECFMNSITYARATMQSTKFANEVKADWLSKLTVQVATALAWYARLKQQFPDAEEQMRLLGFIIPE